MRCIYLSVDEICKAHPYGEKFDYKPEAEMLALRCKHDYDIKSCPRLITYQEHLKAISE